MHISTLFVAYSHWDECWAVMEYGNPDALIFLDADDINNRAEAEAEAGKVIAQQLREFRAVIGG